ncbi:MAG: glycosyltransferase, partial [bacterium]
MDKKIILALPVYNEERLLESSVVKLCDYIKDNVHLDCKIIIVNNGSTDKTKEIGNSLANRYLNVEVIHLDVKGRGNALKNVWSNYKADVYSYCDIDLATDITYLNELFNQILKGNNLVVASRYSTGAISKRTIKRWIASVVYIFLVKLFFKTKISDFQCGFKAIDGRVVKEVLPMVLDNGWFFDTELILLTEKAGNYKIKEIPIKWKEMR